MSTIALTMDQINAKVANFRAIVDEWPADIILLRCDGPSKGVSGHLLVNISLGHDSPEPMTIDALAAFATNDDAMAVLSIIRRAAAGDAFTKLFEPETVTIDEACEIAMSKPPQVKAVVRLEATGAVVCVKYVR